MPLQLFVVHRDDDHTKQIEQENKMLLLQVTKQKDTIKDMEFKYNNLFKIEIELIDLLREHGIPFRNIKTLSDPYWR